jgi:predicted nucleic acid-binding protein
MPYLIDSNCVIDHLDGRYESHTLLDRLAPYGITISIVTYMEVYQGVARDPDSEAAEAQFRAFVDSVPVLPFSIAVAERCARLRETLRQQGRRVKGRALDLMIAGTALEYGLTLVTRNWDD